MNWKKIYHIQNIKKSSIIQFIFIYKSYVINQNVVKIYLNSVFYADKQENTKFESFKSTTGHFNVLTFFREIISQFLNIYQVVKTELEKVLWVTWVSLFHCEPFKVKLYLVLIASLMIGMTLNYPTIRIWTPWKAKNQTT